MLDRRGDHLVAFGGVADVDHEHLASATELANFVTHRLKMGGVCGWRSARAPRNANSRAIAIPIPVPPPVTIVTLPER